MSPKQHASVDGCDLGDRHADAENAAPVDGRCEHACQIDALREQLREVERLLAGLSREVAGLRAELAARPSEPTTSTPSPTPASPSTRRPASGITMSASPQMVQPTLRATPDGGRVDGRSSREAKIALFRELFAGRDDVYARRWESSAKGTSGWMPVHAGSSQTPRQAWEYLPLTDEVIASHLAGRETVGLYPLRQDDTCRLLAVDFDGEGWQLDAQAFVEVAEAVGVPAAVEVSRSGDGAHVWIFFAAPVPAAQARAMGAGLLRETMALRCELDLASYDRFFPSQDHLPERGFGNLIALPLQGECRHERNTTVFIDPATFTPYEDQFAFLDSLTRMTPSQVHEVTDGLRPVEVGPEARLHVPKVRSDPAPSATIEARLAGMLAIERAGIPSGLYASLKHLATLSNPAFYKNENLRLSNHATPRFIRCHVEDLEHLYLPRGLTDQATALVAAAGSRLMVRDERTDPDPLEFTFHGELRDEQAEAVDRLAEHDLGVLEAPPGAGKTVIGCALIARHRTPTLIIVDRKPLMDQWRQRLRTHLDVEAGQIGGGKQRPTGTVDIAMIQTVTRNDDVPALLDGYGLVLVDECHHVPAPTVERAIRSIDARRWVGLTATPQRPDGLKDIMVMQCGPIRHRIQPDVDRLARTLRVHHTRLSVTDATDGLSRSELLALINATLVDDTDRDQQVSQDIVDAMGRGRNCLVLTSRTEHVERLAATLRHAGFDPLVLYGSLATSKRNAVHYQLEQDDRQLLLVATDRYIGEGFDCPRLDTLFLAFPISARQRIIQYVGRILRDQPGKHDVEVHDYLDERVPILAAMYRRRLPGYTQLGFTPELEPAPTGPRLAPRRPTRESATPGPPTAPTEPAPDAAKVRAWARDAGLEVAERGRLSAHVLQAYQQAHRSP